MNIASRIAGLLALVVLAGQAAAQDHYSQHFDIPIAVGPTTTTFNIAPYSPPYGNGALLAVLITFGVEDYSKFTQSQTFTGTVTAFVIHTLTMNDHFHDNGQIVEQYSFNTPITQWNLLNNDDRMNNWYQYSGISGAGASFVPGSADFDRFNGTSPVLLDVFRDGENQIQRPQTPAFIGATTRTQGAITVTYTFVPAPAGVAAVVAGALGLIGRRRRAPPANDDEPRRAQQQCRTGCGHHREAEVVPAYLVRVGPGPRAENPEVSGARQRRCSAARQVPAHPRNINHRRRRCIMQIVDRNRKDLVGRKAPGGAAAVPGVSVDAVHAGPGSVLGCCTPAALKNT